MKIGEILYCKKDFRCEDTKTFICRKGDKVKVLRIDDHEIQFGGEAYLIDNGGEAYLIDNGGEAYLIDNGSEECWMVVKRSKDMRHTLSNLYDYFKNIDRIRNVAKNFI